MQLKGRDLDRFMARRPTRRLSRWWLAFTLPAIVLAYTLARVATR